MTDLVNISIAGASRPYDYHVVDGASPVLFLAAGSQVFTIDEDLARNLRNADSEALSMITALAAQGTPSVRQRIPEQPSAISLNIAQACNLACSYCYADEGRFGGSPRMMTLATAQAAIKRLVEGPESAPVFIGFIGGEPLLNRPVLHGAVKYAAALALQARRRISFGITTNGTLVGPEEVALFREHRFAVTVSLDGGRGINDSLRPAKNSKSSFDQVVKQLEPLLREPGSVRIAARATVARTDLDIHGRLSALAAAGFSEAGVSPLRTSPQPGLALTQDDWPAYLAAMRHAAGEEWLRVKHGGAFFFSNLAVALKQLHRGDYRTLPCGSAENYVSINASGQYFTCHRTLDDPSFLLGGPETGPLYSARLDFVDSRRVDTQEPCRSCWARYLCGGGCHAEVLHSGRAGCDYIRGWLEYCIALYPQVLAHRPDLLGEPS